MLKIIAVGSILKNFEKTERENGVIEYNVRMNVSEDFEKNGKKEKQTTLLVFKAFRKLENSLEFELFLQKKGSCAFVELSMPEAKAGISGDGVTKFAYFYSVQSKNIIFLSTPERNYIKLLGSGNLTADANVSSVDSTKKVVNFSMAFNERIKRGGETKENTVFVNAGMFRDADKTSVANFLKKGQKIFVEGRPQTRVVINENGEARSFFNMNVSSIEFLSKAPDNNTGAPSFSDEEINDLPF